MQQNEAVILIMVLFIPVTLLTAYLDYRLVNLHSFRQYIIICTIEYFCFSVGLYLGLGIK